MSQSIADVAKLLENYLKEFPNCVINPGKIGQIKFDSNYNQLNIISKANEDWPELTIKELAKRIYEVNNEITCHELFLPYKAVEISCSCRRGNLIFRYIEDYLVQTDEVMKRIDVLLLKKND